MPSPPDGLRELASTGRVVDWPKTASMVRERLIKVIDTTMEHQPDERVTAEDFALSRERLLNDLAGFDAPPFTLQRLAEVLVQPDRHYRTIYPLLHAIDKVRTGQQPQHTTCEAGYVLTTRTNGARRRETFFVVVALGSSEDPPVWFKPWYCARR